MIPPVGTRLCRACHKPIDGRESNCVAVVGNKQFRVCVDCAKEARL